MNNLSYVEINLANLKSNIYNLKSLISKKTKFMAVVKSNAYGHGIVECSKAAIEAGADWLGVVNIGEAILLKQKLKVKNLKFKIQNVSILVLGYVAPEDFKIAAENDISVAIVNWEQMKSLLNGQIVKLLKNERLRIHLKIETGISRLGFTENEWPMLIEEVKKLLKNIIIEGVYSHFASVEEYDLAYAKKQIEKFKKFKKIFESHMPYTISPKPIYHMAASAAVMILPKSHFDMVRCGISIYGLWPSKEVKTSFMESQALACKGKLKFADPNKKQFNNRTIEQCNNFLKPVLSYKIKIIQIKQLKRGDYIGYGCTYPVDKPMTIAVIPVGYAEGFDRGFSNPAPAGNKSGEVIIKSQRCPIVGRVCMNMSIIDISKLMAYGLRLTAGEEAVLIGKQGNDVITADEWAEKLGTINYEVTTRIPENIKRKFV